MRFSKGFVSGSGVFGHNTPGDVPSHEEMVSDQIASWERRVEDVLLDIQCWRDEGGFSVALDTRPVADAFAALLDEFRRNAVSPLRPGLKRLA